MMVGFKEAYPGLRVLFGCVSKSISMVTVISGRCAGVELQVALVVFRCSGSHLIAG